MTETPSVDPFDEPAETMPAPPPPDIPPPPPTPTTESLPPGAAEQPPAAAQAVEPTYMAEDMAAAAQALGIQPWDAQAIYSAQGKTFMTMNEFQAAVNEWRTPIPETPSETPSL